MQTCLCATNKNISFQGGAIYSALLTQFFPRTAPPDGQTELTVCGWEFQSPARPAITSRTHQVRLGQTACTMLPVKSNNTQWVSVQGSFWFQVQSDLCYSHFCGKSCAVKRKKKGCNFFPRLLRKWENRTYLWCTVIWSIEATVCGEISLIVENQCKTESRLKVQLSLMGKSWVFVKFSEISVIKKC